MSLSNASSGSTSSVAERDADIRSFRVEVSQAELEELRRRIAATRWPDKETVADQSQGVPLAVIQELARYWANDYDWRRFEAQLNALPQFMTEIDGLDIHFIHVRSRHENALPVIITHGWPGSVIELLNVIGPLTDPTAHGGSAEDAFDVVIPSMPGYGYSGKPTETGWDPDHIARAWIELMRRLGYTRYVAQGGDWGALITDVMGAKAPPELLGIHTNMPGTVPPDVSTALALNVLGAGGPPPSGLSEDEQRAYEQLNFLYTKGLGYAIEMITRRRRSYGIADSPVGLAAWMIDHDAASYSDIARRLRRAPGRQPDPGRGPRQRHVLLADEHRDLLGPAVLGEHARLLRRQGRLRPGRRDRLPAMRSTRPRGAGPSGRTPTSSTSTRSTGAATSPPGRSRQLFTDGAARGVPVAPRCPLTPDGDDAGSRRLAHACSARSPTAWLAMRRPCPIEGRLPSFDGATGWLNSPPLTPGRAARPGRPRRLLDVHLRQLASHAAVRARLGRQVRRPGTDDRGRPHARSSASSTTPTTSRAGARPRRSPTRSRSTTTTGCGGRSPTTTGRRSTSPTREGRIRYHHFGEGEYAMTEMAIQQLLLDAGVGGLRSGSRVGRSPRPRGGGRLREPALARDVSRIRSGERLRLARRPVGGRVARLSRRP